MKAVVLVAHVVIGGAVLLDEQDAVEVQERIFQRDPAAELADRLVETIPRGRVADRRPGDLRPQRAKSLSLLRRHVRRQLGFQVDKQRGRATGRHVGRVAVLCDDQRLPPKRQVLLDADFPLLLLDNLRPELLVFGSPPCFQVQADRLRFRSLHGRPDGACQSDKQDCIEGCDSVQGQHVPRPPNEPNPDRMGPRRAALLTSRPCHLCCFESRIRNAIWQRRSFSGRFLTRRLR